MIDDVRANFESPTNPVKAIRLKCRDCTCNQITEIENCTVRVCPLYPFRFGKNPYRTKRELTGDQKERLGKHLKRTLTQN